VDRLSDHQRAVDFVDLQQAHPFIGLRFDWWSDSINRILTLALAGRSVFPNASWVGVDLLGWFLRGRGFRKAAPSHTC
jgi:hypothetical protein